MNKDDEVALAGVPVKRPPSSPLPPTSVRPWPSSSATTAYSVTHAADLTEAHLERHLAEAEGLIAPGELRFRDTITRVSVSPGCCFGLENWRDWWDVTRGQEPWLGHAPTPHITQVAHVIRLRQHDGDPPSIEITRGELSRLLTTAQQHFSGFLDLARQWAATTTRGLADRLISALDHYFMITEAFSSSGGLAAR
ncbi:hypothetical protein [Nonomuraea roseola]|uniref:DUF4254 domain-containing protein n=1 Tax=Nonomuraea roseola TaxID=46179 RepID=A0ABV5Q1T4_9ACTN